MLRRFEYFAPKTINEALSLLHQYGERAKVLAGGTDLLMFMQADKVKPDYVIDLKDLQGLRHIEFDRKNGLRIGALTTIREIETSPVIREKFPLLSGAAGELGSIQIRNLATVGGNLCTASPAADMAPGLLTLGTVAKIVGPKGERSVSMDYFFVGPGKSTLEADEILTELQVPLPPPKTGGFYIKLATRRAMDIAFIGVAATVHLEPETNVCRDVKIALGAVAPTPVRACEAEAILNGKPLDEKILAEAAKAAAAVAKPIDDLRASAEYRRDMVEVLTRRAVAKAYELAQRNGGGK